jgi:gliding motility-associated-like protein
LQFIAYGNLGCHDTLNFIPIKSYIHPAFALSKDTLCLGDSLWFYDKSKSDTTVTTTSWKWQNQVSTLKNPVLKAMETGFGNIELMATNSRGCMDTVFASLRTLTGDSLPPVSDGFNYITVDSINQLKFVLNAHKNNDWRQYYIYNLNDWNQPIASSQKATDTVLHVLGWDVFHHSYCFGVKNENLCFKQSIASRLVTHCQINLSATPDTSAIIVSWNPYSGKKPLEYRLYRSEKNQLPIRINTATGQTYYYLDKEVKCHQIYTYYIEAIFTDGNASRSDTAMAIPIYKNTLPRPHIYNVSVFNENTNELEFQNEFSSQNIASWYLEKSVNGNPFKPFKTWSGFAPTSQQDTDAKTAEDRCYYRYRIEDVCGGFSPYSQICSPLLLQAVPILNEVKLSWNAYAFWPGGVDAYWVESGNLQGEFETIAKTTDTQITLTNIGSRCGEIPKYRVTALSKTNATFKDSTIIYPSISNPVKWKSGFFAFTPNAFTPTGNNLNEVFKPEVLWVKTYSLFIYDRWGNKIYETTGCGAFWDGMVDGKMAASGCYAYRLDLIALNGQKEHKSGTVLLLR